MRIARWLLFVFALSGFAGVVYEAVWSHYLKLFLGHAAYAQAAVLVLFMGGLSLGAALASRLLSQRVNPLLLYAGVEAAIGCYALGFHRLFVALTEAAEQRWIPALAQPIAILLLKYGLSAVLLFPAAVLLGLTFPLMTAGYLRRVERVSAHPESIASLYFVNSFGAVFGVLGASFVLVPSVGLPGALQVAGFTNFAIAVIVWWGARGGATLPAPHVPMNALPATLLLCTAWLTGFSSFVYEVVWIRLLNAVLGSTTHSFEVMLATFILGLALGGAWVRHLLKTVSPSREVLGYVQLAMSVGAFASLAFLDFSFDLTAYLMSGIARTPLGYVFFVVLGVVIAMLIMLPTTICAGMTLPLLTALLYSPQRDERALGRVYAWNTFGAIAGVVATQLVLIPWLGLRASLLVGAAIDLFLGVWLLNATPHPQRRAAWLLIGCATVFAVCTARWVKLDPLKLASGVYRSGVSRLAGDARIIFQRDGRAASVTVIEREGSYRALATNGKVDASMQFDPARPASRDEATQILSGVLPLVAQPRAKRVAVIGIGSGMTTHALLQNPRIERVDTIEIEAAMLEGAAYFRPAVEAAFTDPRSRLIVDDARTYLAAQAKRYDLIVSEPSNPWVSGVSGLFTEEFYRTIRRRLTDDGVLAQWMQLYEITPRLVALVFNAMQRVFPEIAIFELGDGNFLLCASMQTIVPSAPSTALMQTLQPLLARIEIHSADDLLARYVGRGKTLAPLFASYTAQVNSDFFPHLDQAAPMARFVGAQAVNLSEIARAPWPLREMLGEKSFDNSAVFGRSDGIYRTHRVIAEAHALAQTLHHRGERAENVSVAALSSAAIGALHVRRALRAGCLTQDEAEQWRIAAIELASKVVPYVAPKTGKESLRALRADTCAAQPSWNAWHAFFGAMAGRDGPALRAAAARIIDVDAQALERYPVLLGGALVIERAQTHSGPSVASLLATLKESQRQAMCRSIPARTLLAHAGWQGCAP